MNKKFTAHGAAAVLYAICVSSASAQVAWSLDAAAGYDDNVGRASTAKQGSATAAVGGSVGVDDRTGSLTARAAGTGRMVKFLDGDIQNEFYGAFDAAVRYEILEDRLVWTADETFGQGTDNIFAPPSPENRININVFSTGPELTLPLWNRTFARIAARYGKSTYSDVRPDEDRYSGSVGLVRLLSRNLTGSLNASVTRIEFAEPGVAGYDIQQGYLRLEHKSARQSLALDVGSARISGGSDSSSDPLLRLSVKRKLSASWSAEVAGGREFTDTSSQFRNEIQRSGAPVGDAPSAGTPRDTQTLPLATQPLRNDYLRASLGFARQRTTASLGVSRIEESYQGSVQPNNSRTELSLSATRRISPRVEAQVSLRREERVFESLDASDRSIIGDLVISWRLSTRLDGTFSYNYEKRDADIGSVGYASNRFYLGIKYSPRKGASPAGGM